MTMDSINTEMDVWDHVFQVNFCADMLARGLSDAFAKGPGSLSTSLIAGARVHEFVRFTTLGGTGRADT